MSGSHRTTARRRQVDPDRPVGLIIVGVIAGVVVCVVAAAVILNSVVTTGSSTRLTNGSTVESSPVSSRPERTAVPEACSALPKKVADRLVPGAHVTQNDPFEADDQVSQCTWGSYRGKSRQLTVQLRAIGGEAGEAGSAIAARQLQSERRADEAGEGLRNGQKVISKQAVEGIGDEGYAVYSRVADIGEGHGEGIVNIRAGNILVTVHYAGSDGRRTPLAASAAIGGATNAAKETAAGI